MVVDHQECILLPTLPKRSPSLMYWLSKLGLSLKTIRHMTDVGMGFVSWCMHLLVPVSFSCHDIPRPLHLIFPIVYLCNSERLVVLVNGYCTHIPVVLIEITVLYGPVPAPLTAATLIS